MLTECDLTGENGCATVLCKVDACMVDPLIKIAPELLVEGSRGYPTLYTGKMQ